MKYTYKKGYRNKERGLLSFRLACLLCRFTGSTLLCRLFTLDSVLGLDLLGLFLDCQLKHLGLV
jgi:hypothetical protein